MLNVGNYKQFIFESSLDRDNCVKLSSNIGAGGLPGLSCDRGNTDGVGGARRAAHGGTYEHKFRIKSLRDVACWPTVHCYVLPTVHWCICCSVMMSSVSSRCAAVLVVP